MATVKVLVVEDSLTVRMRLCEVLASDEGVEVIGEAADGQQAIELCRDLRPDVVTMDMVLPLMTGLAATEHIMAYFPTPILIVSSSTNRGELFKTYEALAAGAVEVMEKPQASDPDGEWERRFLSTVKLVARIRVITHVRARLAGLAPLPREPQAPSAFPVAAAAGYRVVAVGASTGGPGAMIELLATLPPAFALPLLFVLHIGEPFGGAFAQWLDGRTGRRVMYAQEGALVADAAGWVVMAPPDRHLVVRDGRFHLTRDRERFSCRPSVDVLFESVAREFGSTAIACLLTGMGRDGAAGLLEVRNAGGVTIAQDEATSVVYGMPREAVLLGAASRVLPLGEIGSTVGSLAASTTRRSQ